jgi:hypothetical protein
MEFIDQTLRFRFKEANARVMESPEVTRLFGKDEMAIDDIRTV